MIVIISIVTAMILSYFLRLRLEFIFNLWEVGIWYPKDIIIAWILLYTIIWHCLIIIGGV